MKKAYILVLFALSFAQVSQVSAAGVLQLSQTSVSLNVGQNITVTAYPPSGQIANVFSLTNTAVAQVNAYNNVISIYGQATGNTQATLCTFDNTCATLNISVGTNNNNNSGQITFSQSNVSLNVNQSLAVSVYNNNFGSAYISSNNNPGAVSASLSGSTLNLFGLTAGSSTIVVCANNTQCGSLYVTINGQNLGTISFNPSTVALYTGQATTVSIINSNYNNPSYYISSNSNPNVITASVASSLLYITATNAGTSNLLVCQSAGSCSTLYVTVLNSNSNSGLTFTTPRLPTLYVNQYYSTQLSVTGGSFPYIFYITSGTLPQGLYLTNDGQIYGTPISSSTTSFTVQVRDNFNRTASQSFIITSGSVLGSTTYANGSLVNDSGTIYLTYKNSKSPFSTLAAFQGLGYKLSNVITGSTAGMTNSGFIISSSNLAHPWGSWIRSGSTIYFVHDSGLIPIPTYDIFLNNGGRDALVVNTNGYDFGKPILSVMGYNDSRLQ